MPRRGGAAQTTAVLEAAARRARRPRRRSASRSGAPSRSGRARTSSSSSAVQLTARGGGGGPGGHDRRRDAAGRTRLTGRVALATATGGALPQHAQHGLRERARRARRRGDRARRVGGRARRLPVRPARDRQHRDRGPRLPPRRRGVETGIDLAALVEVSVWIADVLGRDLPGQLARAGIPAGVADPQPTRRRVDDRVRRRSRRTRPTPLEGTRRCCAPPSSWWCSTSRS